MTHNPRPSSSHFNLAKVDIDPLEVNVLLVEDSPSDIELFKNLLSSTNINFNVLAVTSISEAEELLVKKGRKFDCVFLDNLLPDGEGINFPQTLDKKLRAENCFILFTAYGEGDTGIRSIKNGMQDYLVKDMLSAPLLKSSILHSIERHRREARKLSNHKELVEGFSGKDLRRINNQIKEILSLNEVLLGQSSRLSEAKRELLEEVTKKALHLNKDFNTFFTDKLHLI
ncbi:MAG: response regulator [Chlamydiales bacterium]|nr:response regulator [Chlamydiales bacterium]